MGAECRFDDGTDRRVGATLAFVDANAPLYGPHSRGVRPYGDRPFSPAVP